MKAALFLLLSLCAAHGFACPFCNSETAKQIRASLLGPDVWTNVSITVLPFLLFAAIVYFIYHGGFPAKKSFGSPLNQQP